MPEIKKGVGTWAGIIGSVIALVPPLVNQIIDLIENTSSHWTGGEKTSVLAGAVILGATILGRFAQAVAAILKGSTNV
jgi:hypothetical protein